MFEQYQKARTTFVQTVAELASRPQNIETLQNAGKFAHTQRYSNVLYNSTCIIHDIKVSMVTSMQTDKLVQEKMKQQIRDTHA